MSPVILRPNLPPNQTQQFIDNLVIYLNNMYDFKEASALVFKTFLSKFYKFKEKNYTEISEKFTSEDPSKICTNLIISSLFKSSPRFEEVI